MGVSTDGQIHYGVVFEEYFEFPWDNPEFEGDAEDWWIKKTGWKWEGNTDPRTKAYFDSYFKWKKDHPLPVEIVNYQSGEAPAYLLAVPGTGLVARRGYPERFDPKQLSEMIDTNKLSTFMFFVRYHIGEEYIIDGKLGWYLTSYWG